MLAIVDERFVDDQPGRGLGVPGTWVLDAKTAALVRVGVLAAVGSAPVCVEWSTTRALATGATEDEIVDVLLTIAPVIGLGRVVAAAPGVADAGPTDVSVGSFHGRPGSGGQRPPRVRSAMAISASGLW